jgi:hypothetical protein
MVQFLWSFVTKSRIFRPQDSCWSGRPSRIGSTHGWDWSVTGWIGTARLPKQLDSDDAGNLNSIVVFARGRLFHKTSSKVERRRLYTKYLTGQIEADFLDADDERI